ncbi:MAG: sigma factor-like helix-turn-helix DNA-binding protein, partial [Candidatus Poribacteria bacterium]
RVSENSRLVMTLFYLDGCSYEEIAAFLEVPIKTVKSRLHEARKQLRRELLRIVEELFKGHKLKDKFTKDVLARCRCGCLYPNCNQQKIFRTTKGGDKNGCQEKHLWLRMRSAEKHQSHKRREEG